LPNSRLLHSINGNAFNKFLKKKRSLYGTGITDIGIIIIEGALRPRMASVSCLRMCNTLWIELLTTGKWHGDMWKIHAEFEMLLYKLSFSRSHWFFLLTSSTSLPLRRRRRYISPKRWFPYNRQYNVMIQKSQSGLSPERKYQFL
jgi:hypothetical protein